MFHIPTLKSAMAEAGLVVTDGPQMNHKDLAAYLDFARRYFGISQVKAAYGLAYPSTVSSAIPGHPDSLVKTAVLQASPVATVEALMPPVVFPPPTPKPVIPNINDLAKPAIPGEIVDVPGDIPESVPKEEPEEHEEELEEAATAE